MSSKKEQLKQRLIESAERLIEEQGVRKLSAREVTKAAKCALGSLYTVFSDLDELIIHVNSKTLARLAEYIQGNVHGIDEPVALLKEQASSYVAFANANRSLWLALFEYAEMTMADVPQWHQQEQSMLVSFIKEPVMQLSPHLDEQEAMTRARTMFAAVHGIVSFSQQKRFIGLTNEELEPELMRFIDQMVLGLQ